MSDRDVVTWVGRAPCGCALYAHVEPDEPGEKMVAMHRDLAGLQRKGWTLEKRTVGWVRNGGLDFGCPHRRAKRVRRSRGDGQRGLDL